MRERFFDEFKRLASQLGYTPCHQREMGAMVGHSDFPIAVAGALDATGNSKSEPRVATYNFTFNLLTINDCCDGSREQIASHLECDARTLAARLAEADGVAAVELLSARLLPSSKSHLGDVALEVKLRVELFVEDIF